MRRNLYYAFINLNFFLRFCQHEIKHFNPIQNFPDKEKNKNKENEICLECVSKIVEICSGKFSWLLLIFVSPENKLLDKFQILVIYW